MHFEQTADNNAVSTFALKRPDKSKQCHCLQVAQSASLVSCITLGIKLVTPLYHSIATSVSSIYCTLNRSTHL